MTGVVSGTGQDYDGSLAQAIEAGLAAELFALRQIVLPEVGVEDRRMLFSAIAQGLLGYLAAHGTELPVALPNLLGGASQRGQLYVLAPWVELEGATVVGYRWPPGNNVTVRVVGSTTSVTTAAKPSNGVEVLATPHESFRVDLSAIGSPAKGHVVDARDGSGSAAQVVIPT